MDKFMNPAVSQRKVNEKSNPTGLTFCGEEEKSIYAGAGLKLDAFDCFHNVLNDVSEYNFTIADAALILKQLTPDIIKRIIPILSKQHCLSPKRKKKTLGSAEYYEESVIDLEVSKITNEKKENVENGIVKRKPTIKRPDASRPTRMLSPGSNSCSPVSAAVQALISISVPVVGSTNTNTNTQAGGRKQNVESHINRNVSKEETVFIPVSKPATKAFDFGESVVAPVPKPAISNTSKAQTTSYVPPQTEIEEVFVGSKIDGLCEPQNFYKNIASSLLDPISTSSLSDMQGVTSNIGGATMLPTSTNNVCVNQLFGSRPVDFQATMNKTFTTDAILPHFNLFTTSTLSNEMPCALPSFQSPGSLMTTQVTQETQSQLTNILPKLKSIQSQSGQMAYIDQPIVNVSEESAANYNRNQLPVLRPILPKPFLTESLNNNLNIISVISSSGVVSTNTISQLSPVIRMEEKKVISVPPNQIFTKLNPVLNPSEFSAITGTSMSPSVQQRPVLTNAPCFFSNQNETFFYTQGKELRHFLPQFFNDSLLKPKLDSTHQRDPALKSKLTKKSDNPGGNLEVASALLSMGTQPESENDKLQTVDTNCLSNEALDAIKGELKTDVIVNEQGCFQLEDVEIDPRKHQIKPDNFQCGNCKRVFTSILYLARHIKRVCPDMSSRKWKCQRCSKAFRHPFGLQQHMFTHTGERPHKCEQCTKAFYSANDLRRHVRTHSGERPYQCVHCEKRFSTTISLRTHTYIHTGERPHKCPHCPKTFATSSKLSRHVVTHSDKRPFPCDQCSKTFNRSGDLRRHYSLNHGKLQDLLDCDQCNKTFASEKALLNHKRTHQRNLQDTLQQNCYFGN